MKKLLLLSIVCVMFGSCMSEYSKSVYGFKYKEHRKGCYVGKRISY
jgi:hypothetical protein